MASKIKVGSVVGLKGYVEKITCDSEKTFYEVCFPQFDITMICRYEDIYPVEDVIEKNNKLKNELEKIGGDDLDRY